MVAIKDMEMPKNCVECKLFHFYFDLDGVVHHVCKYGNVRRIEKQNKRFLSFKGGRRMTYSDIYDEFRKKFPLAKALDYRPAVEMHVPQLSRAIPNAIVVWLKDGSTVIYISESEVEV